MAVAYLVDPNNQFMTKSGTINVGGHIRVYLAATDDAAVTYKDFNGTVNPHDIILDDNGRAVIIADNAVAYRIEVYDRYNMLQWTQTPVWCMAAGGGVSTVRVQSSDGTISVTRTTEGGTVVYDLSTQVEKEPAPYGTASFSTSGVYATGENFVALPWTQFGGDLTVQDQAFVMPYDAIADVDCDVVVTYDQSLPKSSIFVRMEVEYGTEDFALPTRELDMSQDCPSVHFSFKVPVHEGETLTYKLYYQCAESVSCGIDARSWLNLEVNNLSDDPNNDYELLVNKPSINGVELIGDKSGSELHLQDKLTEGEYIHIDENNVISVTGITPVDNYVTQSAFTAYTASADSSFVYNSSFTAYTADNHTSITSIENNINILSSDVSGKLDATASAMFQPSGNYQTAGDYLSSTDSANFLLTSQSGLFQPSGNYQTKLNWEYDADNNISGVDGSAFAGLVDYIGIAPVMVNNTARTISVDHTGLSIDETMTAYDDGDDIVIGLNSAILAEYQKTADMSAYQLSGDYAFNSSLSSKLDSSAFSSVSGTFLTAVPAGYATESYVDSAVSSKLDVTASSQFITSLPADLATTSDVASAVSGKLDNSASGEWYPLTGNPSGFLTAHQSLSGYATEQYVDSSVSGKLDSTAYNSAQFILTSQSGMFQPSGYYQPSGEYLSATESSNYYSTSNPSGFITSVDLTPYQKTADMSAYQLSGNYLSSTDSAEFLLTSQSGLFQQSGYYQPSGEYLSATESSNYYSTSNPSGFITGVDLSPYQLTADMSAYQPSGDYQTAGNYLSSTDSAEFLLTSQSGMFQPSGNYQPSGDYLSATESANYQLTANMTGYIPVSALGTGEI